MLKFKNIIYFILLVASSTCEELTKRVEDEVYEDDKPSENMILRRSISYTKTSQEESSNLSASLPDDKNDQIPAASGYSGPHYLPADESLGFERDCHSCNQIPWIPVVGKKHSEYGSLYAYSSNSDIPRGEYFSDHGNPYISPSSSYGASSTQHHPKVRYGPPSSQQLPAPRSPPAFKNSIDIPVKGDIFISDYMLPPPIEFKIPSLAYGVPKPYYGPPPGSNIRPFPTASTPVYGAPNHQYGPPKRQYGPPMQDTFPLTIQLQSGQPRPQYGPSPTDGIFPPTRPFNGSSPHLLYGPLRPFQEYGPPPAEGISPPLIPSNSSSSNTQYGPPRPANGFLPPNQYGSSARPFHGPRPQYNFSPQSSYSNSPPPNYGPPPAFDYGAPPTPSYGPPNVTPIPVLLPPPISDNPRPQQLSPQFLQFPFESELIDQGQFQPGSSVQPHSQLQMAYSVEPSEYNNDSIPPALPSDSYGNAVTGESLQYAFPTDTVYSSSSDRGVTKIPPSHSNLNQLQYEFRNFNAGIPSENVEYQSQQSNNVEIQPSIQVANYLASVEHPVDVVQSPLLDISVNQRQAVQSHEVRPTSIHNHLSNDEQKSSDQSSADHSTFRLSENPIVVEDTFTSSSNINSSFTSSQNTNLNRNNNFAESLDDLNDIKATAGAKDEEDLLNKLLSEQGILGNPGVSIVGIQKSDPTGSYHNFTRPSADYSNWIPTDDKNRDFSMTSMVPPAENSNSIWVQQNSETSPTNTQKPLQIIVPYTTNKKVDEFGQQWSPNNDNDVRKTNNGYTTLIPNYMPPMSTEESNWAKFLEDFNLVRSNQATARPFTNPTTAVYNIKDLLTATYDSDSTTAIKLPYDVISLQRNIDDWTHQSFSRSKQGETGGLTATKNIPNDFFSKQSNTFLDTSTQRTDIFDHAPAGSNNKESIVRNGEIETNMIADEDSSTVSSASVTPATSSTPHTLPSLPAAKKFQRNLWDEAQVTVSPFTREKIYVVTPHSYSFYTTPATAWSTAPKIQNGRTNDAAFDSRKYAVRFEPQEKESKKSKQKDFSDKTLLKVIYSEWPHIINNLQTTSEKPTSIHPLLGSMSIPEYVPQLNFTALETIVGYSKVATVVTSPSTPKKTTQASDSSASTTPRSI